MTMTQTPVRPTARTLTTRPPRRTWPYWLAAFVLMAIVGAGAYVVYRTPVFGLQQLEVAAGGGDLSGDVSDEVRAAAGIAEGTPLINIDLDAARRRVLAVPEVATATVARHWPNAVVITVTQRVPVAVTKANGSMWLLDHDGDPYIRVSAANVPAGLLTLQLATPGAGDAATVAALSVAAELKAQVKPLVASISARSAYDVQLLLKDGRTVLWGSPDDGAKKMQILPAALQQPGKTYDVSDPDILTISH
ncbi:cell division protein FtsQ [Nakamurella panacisegetis]|uniref:Cell division protein FtsQ n=1 Tax=Nakamurella panacisegetis TaxID=1090615 RepID=A0A1H0QAZ9_9ACTN|nr:FtsQ-type POTRA domain-containing protein [Nakamurella panacisegetis]SDP13859.1 cell division protein FtsQ [Nakamurella panacisegetis]